MKLIRNAQVYAPDYLGKKDVLVEGSGIVKIQDHINGYKEAEVIDAEGLILAPGLIDLHEHLIGGGGEDGFSSRCPEAELSELIHAGVTTVLGLLGTDGLTRTLPALLAKVREFRSLGIAAFMLSGSYAYPPATFTDSVEKDMVLIPEVIGVKTAVSDHRSSDPQAAELIRLGTEVRRGAMLSGKAGIVTMHMGNGKGGLLPLFAALKQSDIPVSVFLPTHTLRTPELMEQGLQLINTGGNMDATAGTTEYERNETALKICRLLEADQSVRDHLTISSDAYGSQPVFNDEMQCIAITYTKPDSLLKQMQVLVRNGIDLSTALQFLTSNPARILKVRKGRIMEGYDADLLLLDQNLEIYHVYASGKTAMRDSKIFMKGRFE